MTTTVWVPRDAGALALGAEATALALATAAGAGVRLRRNGSRGLYWLEPLVEVECGTDRIAYGPVTARDVPELLQGGMLQGAAHRLRLGPIEAASVARIATTTHLRARRTHRPARPRRSV